MRITQYATTEYNDIAIAGHYGTAITKRIALTGDWGTATTRFGGTSIAGQGGDVSTGEMGIAIAGIGGTAAAGDGGIIIIRDADGVPHVGRIGEHGLKPNVRYRLNDSGEFEEVPA